MNIASDIGKSEQTGSHGYPFQDSFGFDNQWQNFKRLIGIAIPHPAIVQLTKWQVAAKFNRTIERLKSPRRVMLSCLAILLTLVWLGQAIAGVMLRRTATTESLMKWIPMSLGVYFVWNLIKTVGQKPVEPFDWTETEREWLFGAPLQRSDIIQYRFSAIVRAAFVKSLIFTLVMIPDLDVLPLAFLGIFVALVFIDLVRVLFEIVTFGMNRKQLVAARCLIFGAVAIVAVRAIGISVFHHDFSANIESAAAFGFLFQLFSELSIQANAWYGKALLFPFQEIAKVIIADSIRIDALLKLAIAGGTVLSIAKWVPTWDQFFLEKRMSAERNCLSSANQISIQKNSKQPIATFDNNRIKAPAYWYGCGGLAWRQWIGALNFRSSLALSLLIPALLSCMPSFSGVTDFALVANTVGALSFYSLVLLPASLKFDFRRDIDRLVILKSLPLSPLKICLGQLAIPVLITTMFQLVSLLLVMLLSPYKPLFVIGAISVLLPFNIFIFAFENLAFLWFPHRIHQEGMQIFIRSMLVFTAKSLLFAIASFATYAWVLASKWICNTYFADWQLLNTANLFAWGMITLMTSVSIITFALLTRAFGKFDPSADLVGLD